MCNYNYVCLFPWKQTERHFIMQVVCEATQCNCVPVQVAALQNLVKIMSLYYQYMESYMGPALFAVSHFLASISLCFVYKSRMFVCMYTCIYTDHIRSNEIPSRWNSSPRNRVLVDSLRWRSWPSNRSSWSWWTWSSSSTSLTVLRKGSTAVPRTNPYDHTRQTGLSMHERSWTFLKYVWNVLGSWLWHKLHVFKWE